jgi:hypothetical protein
MTGWRKRQVTDMARESWLDVYGLGHDRQSFIKALEAFAELVRADERENFAVKCDEAVSKNKEAYLKLDANEFGPMLVIKGAIEQAENLAAFARGLT